MALQRYISTSFWTDAWVEKLNPTEKLLYLYLMTNDQTTIAGVYKSTLKRMSFDTSISETEIDEILDSFGKSGKAFRKGEYLILPRWPKHQRWQDRSKIKLGIIACLQELDDEMLQFLESVGYDFPLDEVRETIIAGKNRASISGSKRKRIIDRFGGRCAGCGADGQLFIDHIVALEDGGGNEEENLQPLCDECHTAKHKSKYGKRTGPHTTKGLDSSPELSDSDSESESDQRTLTQSDISSSRAHASSPEGSRSRDEEGDPFGEEERGEQTERSVNGHRELDGLIGKLAETSRARNGPE